MGFHYSAHFLESCMCYKSCCYSILVIMSDMSATLYVEFGVSFQSCSSRSNGADGEWPLSKHPNSIFCLKHCLPLSVDWDAPHTLHRLSCYLGKGLLFETLDIMNVDSVVICDPLKQITEDEGQWMFILELCLLHFMCCYTAALCNRYICFSKNTILQGQGIMNTHAL